jgi:hypothetical protein
VEQRFETIAQVFGAADAESVGGALADADVLATALDDAGIEVAVELHRRLRMGRAGASAKQCDGQERFLHYRCSQDRGERMQNVEAGRSGHLDCFKLQGWLFGQLSVARLVDR